VHNAFVELLWFRAFIHCINFISVEDMHTEGWCDNHGMGGTCMGRYRQLTNVDNCMNGWADVLENGDRHS